MNKKINTENLIGISALLVHAARIDEHYSEKERKIIIHFIEKQTDNSKEVINILNKAEELESNSNQLLSFTKIIKKDSLDFKSAIIKELWKIIISDTNCDEFELSLMRRICGLIYFSDKLSGEIKLSILKDTK
jgi:uncharacterized tellurite resistance protein B-like protein